LKNIGSITAVLRQEIEKLEEASRQQPAQAHLTDRLAQLNLKRQSQTEVLHKLEAEEGDLGKQMLNSTRYRYRYCILSTTTAQKSGFLLNNKKQQLFS
jgi:hypothetical protein